MKRQGVALCVLSAAAAPAWAQDCQGWQSPDRALLDGATASVSWDPARSEALVFRARVQGDRSDFLVCRDGRAEALASFPGEPALASQHACFDAARGVMVLLGRASPATYVWDGQAWSVRPAPAELTHWVGPMVFDAARGVIIVLVNEQGPWYRLTAWEWDGAAWTRSPAAGPPEASLSSLAMGFDAASGRVVLSRTLSQNDAAETWEFDGTVWTLANAGSAGPEDADRLFTDGTTGRVFGVDLNGHERRWDGAAWQDGAGWGFTQEYAFDYDPAGDRLFTAPVAGDVRAWDRQGVRPFLTPGPTRPIYGFEAGYWDAARGTVRLAAPLDYFEPAFWERAGGGDWTADDSWGYRPYDGAWTVPTPDGHAFVIVRMSDGAPRGLCEWREGRWSTRPVAGGPNLSALVGTAVATDLARGRLVCFGGGGRGGLGSVIVNDLWEYTPGADRWEQIPVAGAWPSARQNAAAAWDPVGRRVFIFGGSQSARFNDLWSWDGSAWSNVGGAGGPSARINAAMAFDARRNTLVLFGGRASSFVGDTWEWNESWRQVSASGGPPAGAHLMAYDAARGVCVLTANVAGGLAVWEYGPSGWASAGTFTAPRRAFGLSPDPAGGGVVVTGDNSEVSATPQAWRWDGSGFTRVTPRVPDAPEPMMCYDAGRGRVVLFGGTVHSGETATATATTDQLWELDGSTWIHRQETGPSARSAGAMVYESSRSRVLLFGGISATVVLGDTWAWDGTAWTLLATDGPQPRLRGVMAHDPIRGVTLMVGGDDNGPGTGMPDLWEFDGHAWALVGQAPTSINEISRPLMYFDADLGAVVYEADAGQWRRTADGWAPVFGNPPLGTREHAIFAARDPDRGETVRLWTEHMGTPVTLLRAGDGLRVLEDPSDAAAMPGGDLEITALARGRAPVSARWEHDGVPVVDGGRVSGATTRRLRISGVEPGDAGRYRMIASTECSEVATAEAVVAIACPADFNRDGFLDFFDYGDFVGCFEGAACPPGTSADFNGDGFADFFDYADFVAAFESGC